MSKDGSDKKLSVEEIIALHNTNTKAEASVSTPREVGKLKPGQKNLWEQQQEKQDLKTPTAKAKVTSSIQNSVDPQLQAQPEGASGTGSDTEQNRFPNKQNVLPHNVEEFTEENLSFTNNPVPTTETVPNIPTTETVPNKQELALTKKQIEDSIASSLKEIPQGKVKAEIQKLNEVIAHNNEPLSGEVFKTPAEREALKKELAELGDQNRTTINEANTAIDEAIKEKQAEQQTQYNERVALSGGEPLSVKDRVAEFEKKLKTAQFSTIPTTPTKVAETAKNLYNTLANSIENPQRNKSSTEATTTPPHNTPTKNDPTKSKISASAQTDTIQVLNQELHDQIEKLEKTVAATPSLQKDSEDMFQSLFNTFDKILESNKKHTELLEAMLEAINKLNEQLAKGELSSKVIGQVFTEIKAAQAEADGAPYIPQPMMPWGENTANMLQPMWGGNTQEPDTTNQAKGSRAQRAGASEEEDRFTRLLRDIVAMPEAQHYIDPEKDSEKAIHISKEAAGCAGEMHLRSLKFSVREDGTYNDPRPSEDYTGPIFMPRLGGDGKPLYEAGEQVYDVLIYKGGKVQTELSFIAPDGVPPGSRPTVNPETVALCHDAAAQAAGNPNLIKDNKANLVSYIETVKGQNMSELKTQNIAEVEAAKKYIVQGGERSSNHTPGNIRRASIGIS